MSSHMLKITHTGDFPLQFIFPAESLLQCARPSDPTIDDSLRGVLPGVCPCQPVVTEQPDGDKTSSGLTMAIDMSVPKRLKNT